LESCTRVAFPWGFWAGKVPGTRNSPATANTLAQVFFNINFDIPILAVSVTLPERPVL
jgi:hypothetical protein